MRLKHMDVILAISQAGSMRAAAKVLGKSQPALTSALRQVEEELNVQLFQRTPKGMVPTEIGTQVLTRAKAVLFELDRLRDDVAQMQNYTSGTVRICVSPYAAISILPRAVAALRITFPKVSVHAATGLFPRTFADVQDGRYDIVVGPVQGDDMPPELDVRPLLDTRLVAITRANSEFAGVTELKHLLTANWIYMRDPEGGPDIASTVFAAAGLQAPEPIMTSESFIVAAVMALQNGNVCFFPEKLLHEFNPRGAIAVIPLSAALPVVQISMVTRGSQSLTPASRELARCIERRVNTMMNHAPNLGVPLSAG